MTRLVASISLEVVTRVPSKRLAVLFGTSFFVDQTGILEQTPIMQRHAVLFPEWLEFDVSCPLAPVLFVWRRRWFVIMNRPCLHPCHRSRHLRGLPNPRHPLLLLPPRRVDPLPSR